MLLNFFGQLYARGYELAMMWGTNTGMQLAYLTVALSILLCEDNERTVLYHTTTALSDLVKSDE